MSNLTDFIKESEGTRMRGKMHMSYQDQAGVWTIGYGHTGPEVGPNQFINEDKAETYLQGDLRGSEAAYEKLVTVDLPENQRNAVVSLIFNVGAGAFGKSKALSHLNNADYKKFAYEAFDKYQGFTKITVGGQKKVNKGLINRREAERTLFVDGIGEAPEPVKPLGPYAPKETFETRMADRGDEFTKHPVLGTDTNLNPITRLPDPQKRDVSFFDAMHAGLVLNNPISGMIDRGGVKPQFKNDPNYNISEDPNLRDNDLMRYVDSRSSQESEYIKKDIDRNAIYQELATHRGGGYGMILGVVGNPIIMGPAIATGGASIGAMAAADITAEVLSEAILHSQQPLRTKTETAINIGLVGAIDGALWRLSTTAAKRAERRVLRNAALDLIKDPKPHFTYQGVDPKTGKVKVKPLTRAGEPLTGMDGKILEDQKVLDVSAHGEGVDDGFVPGMKFSPAGDVIAHSFSQTAKLAVQQLVDVPYRFVKSIMGGTAVPASAESKIKKAVGDQNTMIDTFAEKFAAYRKGGGPLPKEDFLTEVHRTMESGSSSGNPHIDSVAEVFTKFDNQYRAIDEADGVATKAGRRKGGHIQRIYSQAKIAGNRAGLKAVITKYIRRAGDSGSGQRLVRLVDPEGGHIYDVMSEADAQLAKAENPKNYVFDNEHLWDDLELDKITDDIVNRMSSIRNGDAEVGPDLIVFTPNSARARTLGFIPTRELEPWLEMNAVTVMSVRSRQHYRAKAMRDAFPDDPSMVKTIEKVKEEYVALMKEEGADVPALTQRLNTDLVKLGALRDSIMGQYGIPKDPTSAIVRYARLARIGTLMGYGANIASTSLSDFLTPALRNGLAPFRQGIKILFKRAAKKEFMRQIRMMGIATESVLNNKAALMSNMIQVTKKEQVALKNFGKYTGLDWVTDTSQAYNAMSHSMLYKKWFDNFDKLGDAKKLRLLDVGIDAKMVKRIKAQWDEFGEVIDGMRLPSAHLWDDQIVAEAFENAIRKETYMTTLVPGKGDIPHWLQTEPGKFFGMFQSFVAGAHQRLLIAGFQRNDADFYTGILVAAVGGGLVQAGKDIARGKDPTERDPFDYVVRSLDKSGLLGWFGTPAKAAGAVIRGEAPEFIWRNVSDTAFRPPALDWLMVFGTPAIGMAQGDLPESEEMFDMAKALPMLNSFHLVDMAEQLTEEEK